MLPEEVEKKLGMSTQTLLLEKCLEGTDYEKQASNWDNCCSSTRNDDGLYESDGRAYGEPNYRRSYYR